MKLQNVFQSTSQRGTSRREKNNAGKATSQFCTRPAMEKYKVLRGRE